MSEFQEFINYFKESLMNKVNALIESEFRKFEDTYVKFNNNSDSDDNVKQDLSSTSDSGSDSGQDRESSPERD
jgi:hypothetical protein